MADSALTNESFTCFLDAEGSAQYGSLTRMLLQNQNRSACLFSVHLDSLQDSHTDTILVLAATGEMRHCTPKQTGRTY